MEQHVIEKPQATSKNRAKNAEDEEEEEIEFNYQPSREKNPFASLRDYSPPPASTAEEFSGSGSFAGASGIFAGASGSSPQKGSRRRRMLNFEIDYRHQQIPINIDDSATVGKKNF